MDLLSFVRSLPKGYAYTPVYGMGVQLPKVSLLRARNRKVRPITTITTQKLLLSVLSASRTSSRLLAFGLVHVPTGLSSSTLTGIWAQLRKSGAQT